MANDNTSAKDTTSNKPLGVFTVREGKTEEDKDFWTRIGAAWPHKDRKGFNVTLDAFPVNGRLVIRQDDR